MVAQLSECIENHASLGQFLRVIREAVFQAIVLSLAQIKLFSGTSLVAQWLRIRLPVQGTQVRALVWEDPTCRGATKPMRHNY